MNEEFQKLFTGEKMRNDGIFQEGVEIFRNTHNLPSLFPEARERIGNKKLLREPIAYYTWYKKLVGREQVGSLNVITTEGVGNNKRFLVAFRSVKPQEDCLEMTAVEIRNILEK